MENPESWATNALCRCCHSEKTLALETKSSDKKIKENTYFDLLRDTFGIFMSPIPEVHVTPNCSICNDCITKLQDATKFKQQVITCESIFNKWYNKFHCKDTELNKPIKLELCEALDCELEDEKQSEITERNWVELPEDEIKDATPKAKKTKKKKTHPKATTKVYTFSKHKCNICGLKFTYKKHLVNHTTKHHPNIENSSCTTCLQTFEDSYQLKKHSKTHEMNKKLKCLICEKLLKRNCYKEHMKLHENPQFVCDVCGKAFFQQSQLFRHKTVHTGAKPYSCEECNKKFTRKSTLVVHKRRHRGEKPYKCNICDKSFTDPSAKNVHMRLHTGIKPFTCTFCALSFTHIGTLKRHERTHTGERPFSCKLCDKQFGSASAIKPHMRTHTGEKPFKCDQCNQGFSEKTSLQRHMNVHSGVKPYTCKICNKQISCLQKHMRVMHSGEKPFMCSFCDKRFADNSYLKLHIRTHTGERPFACERCGRRFTQSHVLKNHRCAYEEAKKI